MNTLTETKIEKKIRSNKGLKVPKLYLYVNSGKANKLKIGKMAVVLFILCAMAFAAVPINCGKENFMKKIS